MKNIDKVLKIIQKYPENNFTKEGIIPLLQKMGYKGVEFYGGTDEHGKDILFWEEDKWGNMILRVAQVKHLISSKKYNDKSSIQSIVNQLVGCFNTKLKLNKKVEEYPSEAFLFTTHRIDTKILMARFNSEPSLTDRKIRIIEGEELVKKLFEYTPEFIKKIVGPSMELDLKINHNFSNTIVHKVLGDKSYKDIRNIYSDIDFSLGRINSNYFFNSSFDVHASEISLDVNKWEKFKDLLNVLKKEYTLSFLIDDLENIENKNKRIFQKFKEYSEDLNKISSTIGRNRKVLSILTVEIDELNMSISEINTKLKTLAIDLSKIDKNKDFDKFTKLSFLSKVEHEKAEEFKKKLNKKKSEKNEIDKNGLTLEKQSFMIIQKSERLKISVFLDGISLVNQITSKRTWIENTISKYNQNRPTPIELKQFLEKCENIIDCTSLIYDKRNIDYFSFLGINYKLLIRTDFDNTRFRIPIDFIFDTGMNLSVLGDAGAGKSTSLEMYALSRKNANRKVLLIPLNKLVNTNNTFQILDGEMIDYLKLEKLILKYFKSLALDISLFELQDFLIKESVTILFDGLDEAIKSEPYLAEEIKELSKKYVSTQFILTSRMHGEYIDKIPFFSVTLLPFTAVQRDMFIEKWFENEEGGKENIQRIKEHFEQNKNIGEIVRNPLLVTTLCVLAKHKITLPKTEIRLYDDRLMLLTGYYDSFRSVTRIVSKPNLLECISEKLAFYLHDNNIREEELDVLRKRAHRMLQNRVDRKEIDIAFAELMHPCEILIPMSQEGKYGFGHLRYQEHLAARELNNREINIIALVSQDWWKSTLILFSLLNDNIEWLIKEMGNKGQINLPIVKTLISTRHSYERKILQNIVDSYVIPEDEIGYL